MNKPAKDVSHYLSLSYTIRLRRDEDGDIVARIEELPGCVSHGSDEVEALNNLREMQKLWLEDCIAAGELIPEPQKDERLPSGKWVQRVPRSLHRHLVQMAKVEGVSLNHLVTSMLAQQLSARAIQRSVQELVAEYASSKQERLSHSWENLLDLEWLAFHEQTTRGQTVSLRDVMTRGIPDKLEVKVSHAFEESKEEIYFATCER